MDFFREMATDAKAEVEGAWIAFNPEIKFKIGRHLNSNYRRTLAKLYNDNRAAMEKKDEAAEALGEAITKQCMAETVLLGWEGPVEYDGVALTSGVSADAAKLLSIPDFFNWVLERSLEIEHFRAKRLEAAEGK